MINRMMQETLLTGTARKAALGDWPAAGKTGTSQEFRDAWFVGYTSHLVTAVWLGNDNSSPMRKVTGGGMPVEIWARYMRRAHQRLTPAPLPGVADPVPPPVAQRGPLFGGEAPRPPADVSPQPAAAGARAAAGSTCGSSTGCSARADSTHRRAPIHPQAGAVSGTIARRGADFAGTFG